MNGDRIPLAAGDFVWSMFPFEDRPDSPAPVRHTAVVMAAFNPREALRLAPRTIPAHGLVVAVYTSSQVLKWEERTPVGVIKVDEKTALRLGNRKAFFIDVRKRAFLPYTKIFFPGRDEPNHGVFAKADKALLKRIMDEFRRITERHQEMVVNLGPMRPSGG